MAATARQLAKKGGRVASSDARLTVCGAVRVAPRVSPGGKLQELRNALETVAQLIDRDESYLPIFVRLEQEILLEEAKVVNDPLARARALARQYAIGAISPRT